MKLQKLFIIALAAFCCTGAMAQKAKKAKKGGKKVIAASVLTPAHKILDGKTFSYSLGVAQGNSLVAFLTNQLGVDSAYVGEALKAMTSTASEADRKRAAAIAAGYRVAEMNNRNLPMLNEQACGKKDSAYISRSEFERGLVESANGIAAITRDSAMQLIEGQFKFQADVYKAKNVEFLAKNKKQKGIITLPSGLQYQVISKGKGAVATDSTEVDVHYEGTLIDGTKFDSSYDRGKPATFRPNQVIPGWREALKLMPEGSVWKLYVPSELGYGEQGARPNIPGNSTLIFTVEVIKVKK
uniref:FKBP-type peptidyl-prolyl cis-trans isomerase n=1 Tax=Alloprevotella sp. TaxID=1872471 RepID=UPI0015B294C7